MKYLYSSPLPEAATTDESDSLGQQLSELGLLDEDSAAVESISSQAADLTLEGQYRWGEKYAGMVAAELDELADASLAQLPLYQRGGSYGNQGYYEVESADVKPVHANRRDVWQYSLSLTFVGKRGSKFRAVATNPSQHEHPWTSTVESYVGIPAGARKVRWLDSETGQVAAASAVATVATEPIDVALYDLAAGENALGLDDPPLLVYDAAYPDDVRASVRVYDTRGYTEKFAQSGDGSRQWQIVHSTEHDVEQPMVVSNGRLRVMIDEQGPPDITAERWDASAGAWAAVEEVETAGAETDWSVYDLDITEVRMQDVRCQLGFEHPDQGLFDLNTSLQVGRDGVLCWSADGSAVPSDIQTWLDPIAADWTPDPQPERTLVDRTELRQ
jgi:hypothetical protein